MSIPLQAVAIPSSSEDEIASAWRLPFPLTLRGSLTLACALYLLLGPARLEVDIVATTLGYSFAALLTLLLIGTIVQGVRLRRIVTLEINRGGEIERFESESGTTLVLKLPRFSVAPGYVLTLKPRFASSEVALPQFRLTGTARGSRYLTYRITFPHRGIWSIAQVSVNFGDQIGLTRLRWDLFGAEIQRSFTVYPALGEHRALPIISSCERPGDLLTHAQERHGDPFDLRQYHPADGARRILWKIFARRGELISRHPEASMTPEGQVVVFTPALASEDHLCSVVTQYATQLRELQLDLFFGCSGMENDPAARTPEQVETMLVDSVWHSDQRTEPARLEFAHFLGTLTNGLGRDYLRRALIFTSPQRFRSAADLTLMLNLTETLEQQSIEPVIIVVLKPGATPLTSEVLRKVSSHHGFASTARRWFFTIPDDHPTGASTYRTFLATCARKNWQVHLEGFTGSR